MSGPLRFSFSLLHKILCLTLLFLSVWVAEPGPQATAQGITNLEAGNAVQRDLTGGQKHSYRITLPKGQYAGLVIEHQGIDVVARLLGPEGKLVAEFDDELRVQGQERPELVAEESGSYRLEVEAKRLQ